ncbi:HAD-superfamily hydrolase, subfamily IIA, CECR5 [Corchorus olitorius]|uniref:HAD-superfamily hydrolase, subfamily IIA, CECR5 n=1 Tax=Corchorus olitorius TaxID=93759 RepID=A0A1R3J977_9ROSI|nr:HAD-superfamily hydrolase, subfamily IIA, CECR5 [Corchorus olitorius]
MVNFLRLKNANLICYVLVFAPALLHKALIGSFSWTGVLKIPFIFLTNGGGVRESKRAAELSELLGVKISPLQVVQGHSPFKQMVNRFEKELIVAVGKGEPAAVMSEYGFKNVISIDEYALCFDNIDPLAPYKKWSTMEAAVSSTRKSSINSARVQAAFVVSDSVDWSRDVQVLCDILRTGGLPGSEEGPQPPLFFAHDDLKYQPNPVAFKNAEVVLKQLASSLHHNLTTVDHANSRSHDFQTLYMIGDNPLVDIKGARQAGHPWFPILTRTGVFKGNPHSNHAEFPANLVST